MNKLVIVTRPQEQAQELEALLLQQGMNVITLPLIRTEPIIDRVIDLADLGKYDWLIFTSGNGVRYFPPSIDLCAIKVGVVGSKTAESFAAKFGRAADFVPCNQTGEGLGLEIPEVEGKRILIIGPEEPIYTLDRALTARHVKEIRRVALYRTASETPSAREIDRIGNSLPSGVIWIAYSPSALRSLAKLIGFYENFLADSVLVVVGSTTAKQAQAIGWKKIVRCDSPDNQQIFELVKKL